MREKKEKKITQRRRGRRGDAEEDSEKRFTETGTETPRTQSSEGNGPETQDLRAEEAAISKRDSSLRRPIGSQERIDAEKSACSARNDRWEVSPDRNDCWLLVIGKDRPGPEKSGPEGPPLQQPLQPERRTTFICGDSLGPGGGVGLLRRAWGGGVWLVVRQGRRSGVGRRCSRN